MPTETILSALRDKYGHLHQDADVYLKGLLHAKPITYWDYVEVDALLSLQHPRTDFADEYVFIVYHQITELSLRLLLHELEQVTGTNQPTEQQMITKVKRVNRYTELLINSFDIMREGMSYDDYNEFRHTLTPASGFQSAQFRLAEIRCTRLVNLLTRTGKQNLAEDAPVSDQFDYIYWKMAGTDHATGQQSLTMRLFIEKYQPSFIQLATQLQGGTLEEQALRLEKAGRLGPELRDLLRRFDQLFNIEWPLVHLRTAEYYLDSKGENKAATGGSEWKKYLHPQYQQRRFFPTLWSEEEKANWAK
ncbi:MAG: tryptophan 2,3-dioxygenase [Saprospiraceae bacterium]|jgi:tryptophan 2,3-dioxygenase|nr:tryptophan 2,3-dioxygenase [Saprospiraceae bacterium]